MVVPSTLCVSCQHEGGRILGVMESLSMLSESICSLIPDKETEHQVYEAVKMNLKVTGMHWMLKILKT